MASHNTSRKLRKMPACHSTRVIDNFVMSFSLNNKYSEIIKSYMQCRAICYMLYIYICYKSYMSNSTMCVLSICMCISHIVICISL